MHMHGSFRENIQEAIVSQFLIIAYPHETCGCASILPDIVGVTGRGSEMGLAIWRATKAAQQVCDILAQLNQPLPVPTDIAAARKRLGWVGAYGVDWSTAVVRSVGLGDTPEIIGRRRVTRHAFKPAALAAKQGSRGNGAFPIHRPKLM